jgi:hypothetical protein
MTRRVGLAVLAGLLAVVLHPPAPAMAQTPTKDVSKKTVEAWDAVKDYTVEKKNDAVAYGKKLVRETDGKIKQLEGKAAKASGDTKAEYDKAIKDLKAKRAQAAKTLDEMGKATASSWDAAKQGFADAYKDLQQSFEKVVAQFK